MTKNAEKRGVSRRKKQPGLEERLELQREAAQAALDDYGKEVEEREAQRRQETAESRTSTEALQSGRTAKPDPAGLPLDLLNRDSFIENVFNIAQVFHLQKKTACYAINGKWGTGKTFILDRLEKRLQQPGAEQGEFDYLVLRYNCWEYDYYDEPLLSIVAAMLDAIQKHSMLSSKARASITAVARYVGNLLLNGFIAYMDTKTDGMASKLAETVGGIAEDRDAELAKASAFNENLPFQKALKTLREQIKYLAKEHTVVFLVDELDRCLPEYAIRVLERLHHLFEGIDNVQLIFSVDRCQLEHVVRQLYGPEADAAAYLKKFISFELRLSPGTLSTGWEEHFDPALQGSFDCRFSAYAELFAPCAAGEEQELAEFKAHILDGFDVRKRIALVEKAELVHRLTWPADRAENPGAYVLCLELLLTVFQTNPNHRAARLVTDNGGYQWDFYDPKVLPMGFACMRDALFQNKTHAGKTMIRSDPPRTLIDTDCLTGYLIGVLTALDNPSELYLSKNGNWFRADGAELAYERSFWDLLNRME